MVPQACNLRIGEVAKAGSEVQIQSWLHNEFEDTLNYMRTYLKNMEKHKQTTTESPIEDLIHLITKLAQTIK